MEWAARALDWPHYALDYLYAVNEVLNEVDYLPLTILHDLLLSAKLARHYKGTMRLTKLPRDLKASPQSDEPILSNEAMELGQLVQSPSIIGSTVKLPPADLPSEWAGQPGVRAPHLWVSKEGRRISTIDLFGQGFVLLSADACWIAAAKAVASNFGVDIDTVHIGSNVLFPEPEMLEVHFGIAPDGASLIRPDGVVAWRSSTMASSPEEELESAFKQIADLLG